MGSPLGHQSDFSYVHKRNLDDGLWRSLDDSLCACVAWHIIFTGEFAPVSDIYWLTTIQIGVVALLATFAAQWGRHSVFIWHPETLWTLVISCPVCNCFCFPRSDLYPASHQPLAHRSYLLHRTGLCRPLCLLGCLRETGILRHHRGNTYSCRDGDLPSNHLKV